MKNSNEQKCLTDEANISNLNKNNFWGISSEAKERKDDLNVPSNTAIILFPITLNVFKDIIQ